MEDVLTPEYSDGHHFGDHYALSGLLQEHLPNQSGLFPQAVPFSDLNQDLFWDYSTTDRLLSDTESFTIPIGTSSDPTSSIELTGIAINHSANLRHGPITGSNCVYPQQQSGYGGDTILQLQGVDDQNNNQLLGFEFDFANAELEPWGWAADHAYPNQVLDVTGLDQNTRSAAITLNIQQDTMTMKPNLAFFCDLSSAKKRKINPASRAQDASSAETELSSAPIQRPVHRSRRLKHTRQEWLEIQPIFKQLYIDEDRNLSDVVKILSQEHNFTASEHMFKKRISAWGLAKYRKAHKELTEPSDTDQSSSSIDVAVNQSHTAALVYGKMLTLFTSPESTGYSLDDANVPAYCVLARLLDCSTRESTSTTCDSPVMDVTKDKSRAHLKSCAGCRKRLGIIDHEVSRLFDDLCKDDHIHFNIMMQLASESMSDTIGPLETAQLIFRCITSCSTTLSQDDLVSIDFLLESARIYFRLNLVSRCIQAVRELFDRYQAQLTSSPADMIFLLHNLTHDLWGTSKISDGILRILCQIAGRCTEDRYKMAQAIKGFISIAGDVNAQAVMWQSLMELYNGSIFEDVAMWQRIILNDIHCTRRTNKFVAAWQACERAATQLDSLSGLNLEGKASVAFEHAQTLFVAGNFTSAIEKYRQARHFASKSGNTILQTKIVLQIAQLYNSQRGCRSQAQWHFVQAFHMAKRIPGPYGSYKLLAFKMLEEFHFIHNIEPVELLLQEDYHSLDGPHQYMTIASPRSTAYSGDSPRSVASIPAIQRITKRAKPSISQLGRVMATQRSDDILEITRDVFQQEISRKLAKQSLGR